MLFLSPDKLRRFRLPTPHRALPPFPHTMKEAIILYPSPAIGHLISMVELGKLMLTHHPSLSIHILITNQAYNAGSTTSYISSAVPSITFHNLATVSLPPYFTTTSPHHEALALELIRLNNPNVHQALVSISKTHRIKALIIDYFCSIAILISRELNIPCYYFFTSGGGCLSFMLYLTTLDKNTTKSFKDIDVLLDVPGIPPLPGLDVPKPLQDREDICYKTCLQCSQYMQASDGIIVNTFEMLEPRPIQAIRDGLCVPDGTTPPLYCVGPLTATRGAEGGGAAGRDCLKWLDSQPSGSVVFLCFGSLGTFSSEQLKGIALGIERSDKRFLWVVKNPPHDKNGTTAITALAEPDLESLLPAGFLDRTKDRGLVVKSWAPQIEVLSHDAVGGFVTHCGWNSVLEAVCAGVPMIAWPLYAEQRQNRVLMVEEMKIALSMQEMENGFVNASEVEKRVRELMDSELGDSVRKKTLAMKEEGKTAMSRDGTSHVAMSKLLKSWKNVN